MRARSSLRVRRRETALRRMRERSGYVVVDQEGKADLALLMALSMAVWEEAWMVQTGLAVDGSMDWNVWEEDVDEELG